MSFIDQFTQWFQPATFERLARHSRWLIRRGKIDAFEFIVGLVFGQMSALRLTLNAQASSYSEAVSRQAVDQRYNQRAVTYCKEAFAHCLSESLAQAPTSKWAGQLAAQFKAVYLVDSTAFDCPDSLATLYPGCGGAASEANVKVLLRYEYLQGQFEPKAVVPGRRNDQGLASELIPGLRALELYLLDMGFFTLALLRAFQQAQAYYAMPCPRSVSLWQEDGQGQRIALDLGHALRTSDQGVVEWSQVQLGAVSAQAVSTRLVAYRLNEESAGRQRAGLREAARKQGRQPTAAALELAGWRILLTNAPTDRLPTHALGYCYRIRWQIELIFKQCKSVLRLDVTEARNNIHRVQCEIWARLIAAVVLFRWHAHLQIAAWHQGRWEISFAQVASQLQQRGLALAQALIEGGQRLRDWLWGTWRHLLRTTRKGRQQTRKTTWQLLLEHWLPAPTA